ncbi:MAG: hypothetical protein Tsb002_08620 [Wenzhouxiangellaceae bacterium]
MEDLTRLKEEDIKSFLSQCTDIWSRQRILSSELNHIQQSCAALLDNRDLVKEVSFNAFEIFINAKGDIDFNDPEVDAMRTQQNEKYETISQNYAGRLYTIAQELKFEIHRDHQLLRCLVHGTRYWSVRSIVASMFCEHLNEDMLLECGIPILTYQSNDHIDNITRAILDKTDNITEHITNLFKEFKLFTPDNFKTNIEASVNEKLKDLASGALYEFPGIGTFATHLTTASEHLYGKHHSVKYNEADIRYFYYEFSALRLRVGYFASELGSISRRLNELLESYDPQLILTSASRRYELNFYDHFVRTFTDNIFRDLIILCKDRDYLAADYPYEAQLPIAIHSSIPEGTSEVTGFVRDRHHRKWRTWITSPNAQKLEPYFLGDNALAVRNSFFTEIPTSIPIIAHELAHRVIKEFLGKYTRPELFTRRKKHGVLGDFIRNYHLATNRFLPADKGDSEDFLHVEVLADLLAYVRLGPSYLYAWMTESALTADADLVHLFDEHDRIILDDIEAVARNEDIEYFNESPSDYIRGIFLLELAYATLSAYPKNSLLRQQNTELVNAFSSYLDRLLFIRYRANPFIALGWKKLAYYARKALYQSRFIKKSRKYINDFHKTKDNNHHFMHRQRLSRTFYSVVQQSLSSEETSLDTMSVQNLLSEGACYEAIDLTWRLMWMSADNQLKSLQRQSAGSQKYLEFRIFDWISSFSYLDTLGREDYVATATGRADIWKHISTHQTKYKVVRSIENKIFSKNKSPETEMLNLIYRNESKHKVSTDLQYGAMDDNSKWISVDFFEYEILIEDNLCAKYTIFEKLVLNENHPVKFGNKLKILELFSLSNTKGVNNDSVPGDNQGWLLGAYDYYVLRDYGHDSGFFFRIDSVPTFKDSPFFVRRRPLLPIHINENDPPKSPHSVSGFILIQLKDKSLRSQFLAWLSYEIKHSALGESFTEYYTSQGWEDFVLAFDSSDSARLGTLRSHIKLLADHPFVKKTETLFKREILEQTNTMLKARFMVKVNDTHNFDASFEKKLLEKFNTPKSVEFNLVVGHYDYEIIPHILEDKTLKDFLDILINLSSISKIKTELSIIREQPKAEA